MARTVKLTASAALAFIVLSSCTPDYSPNIYASDAVQQVNKVDRGVVVGYREVRISDDRTIGGMTGGAVGGILGRQANSPIIPTALVTLGGTVVGGIVGTAVQHAAGDTTGWEYIVREPKGDLISVTQQEPTPIPLGQAVLVIEGRQARIVPNYSYRALDPPPPAQVKSRVEITKVATLAATVSVDPSRCCALPSVGSRSWRSTRKDEGGGIARARPRQQSL